PPPRVEPQAPLRLLRAMALPAPGRQQGPDDLLELLGHTRRGRSGCHRRLRLVRGRGRHHQPRHQDPDVPEHQLSPDETPPQGASHDPAGAGLREGEAPSEPPGPARTEPRPPKLSGNEGPDDLAPDVGQAEVATLIMVRQLAMVHTQQMED